MGAVNTTYTFTATDTITSTKMNNIIDQTVMTADALLGGSNGGGGLSIADGKLTISSGAINSSRLATGSVTTDAIADGTIVNADINASAAIAGTKINPNFGSQNIVTTGNVISNVTGNVTGNATSADYATRAANGPINGTFTQDHTANAPKVNIGGFNQFGGDNGINFYPAIATAGDPAEACAFWAVDRTTLRGTININATSVLYTSTSDYRLKEDAIKIQDPINTVNSLNPVNFKWKEDGSRSDGFIAHEVQSIIPNAVVGVKDAVDNDGNPIYQQIDQSKLIPIMVAAIQELSQKVAELEAR